MPKTVTITIQDADIDNVDEAVRAYLGEDAAGLSNDAASVLVIQRLLGDILSRNEGRKAARQASVSHQTALQNLRDEVETSKAAQKSAKTAAEAAARTAASNTSVQVTRS